MRWFGLRDFKLKLGLGQDVDAANLAVVERRIGRAARAGRCTLRVDGNGQWSAADLYVAQLGSAGDLPVVGDFDGDGIDDLGTYRAGKWHLDTDGDRALTAHDKVFELGGPGDRPVVADFNGDGVDEIGIYRDGVTKPGEQVLQPPDAPTADVAARP